ncbi:MAG: hypothetical protein GXY36_19100 [Chloroflexi bacterium]|nr:hypothetical protein [Chloroflexota bacterium]
MTHVHDHEFLLNFLFQSVSAGVLLSDRAGQLERLNPGAAAMLRLDPGEVLGRPAAAALRTRPDLVRLFSQPGDQQGAVSLPHKRLAVGVGVDRPGGGRAVLLHDITEQAALDSRRDALMRAVAHDLRNPLNALSGYADLVGRFGPLNADQDKFLGRIRDIVAKLYELSASLVDLAWIEAGMPLVQEPIDLSRLIHEAVASVTHEAHTRSITIVVSTQEPIPVLIGDPFRIRQAITHLLENAVRYSHPDSNVAIHAWQEGARVFCTVGDQGIGISASDQEHIWDRLWRSNDPRVREVPGGGIGLTFVHIIVERHGGKVWVQSCLDEGTIITFTLPLAESW